MLKRMRQIEDEGHNWIKQKREIRLHPVEEAPTPLEWGDGHEGSGGDGSGLRPKKTLKGFGDWGVKNGGGQGRKWRMEWRWMKTRHK